MRALIHRPVFRVAAPAFRLRLGYRIARRHLVTALYAPLQVNARGSVDRDIAFAGGSYPAGSPLLAVYRFDSYRLTYRYSIVWAEGLDVAAGVTAKIRDAETSLYGVEARRKTNTGFVPLLNVHVAWRPGNGAWCSMPTRSPPRKGGPKTCSWRRPGPSARGSSYALATAWSRAARRTMRSIASRGFTTSSPGWA